MWSENRQKIKVKNENRQRGGREVSLSKSCKLFVSSFSLSHQTAEAHRDRQGGAVREEGTPGSLIASSPPPAASIPSPVDLGHSVGPVVFVVLVVLISACLRRNRQ
ncbi:hypothetical protein E2C01_036143 [Portunus trituberculatus]|uniref:Uncharacterized protein n=1 Tax=Portunus trituberculatus TaxID=210409 RepID=A0A5B7F613_PORTR|nr:hypothetical protein [Portunus trituberculatus]